MLNVSRDDVERRHVADLTRVLGEISDDPQACRQLRGNVVLGFPSYDNDPRPNWAIPEIRGFVQRADAELPHLSYFLVGDPALGYILFYLLCLARTVDLTTYAVSPSELLAVATGKANEVDRFCQAIGDDANAAVLPILLNLPPALAAADPDLSGTILERLRPTLMTLELSDDQAQDEVANAFAEQLLTQAATLLGLDRSRYSSREALRRDILGAMHRQVTEDDLRRFGESFDACTERVGGGKLALSTERLRRVIREQRWAAYRYVDLHIVGAASQPGYLQPAAIVATGIYVEFGDDEPMRRIRERAEELGVPPSVWMPGTR